MGSLESPERNRTGSCVASGIEACRGIASGRAVMNYVPAVLFLATAFTAVYVRSHAPELLFGEGGWC
jgi:hypothetical protein